MPIVNPDETVANTDKLKPGIHKARIIQCEQKIAKSGNPYLNWKFSVIPSNKWAFLMTGLSGKGLEVFKTVVRAAKYPNYVNGPVNTDELIGSQVMITVDYEDGSDWPKVIEVMPSLEAPDFDDDVS